MIVRWVAVNSAYAACLAGAATAYNGHVHPIGKVAVAVVLAVFAVGAWCALEGRSASLSLAIRACPMLALCGTVAGFLIAFGGSTTDVQQRVLGASTGLVATFVGISSALVLMLQRHLLDA